jgi:OPT family oligopeptide transporter
MQFRPWLRVIISFRISSLDITLKFRRVQHSSVRRTIFSSYLVSLRNLLGQLISTVLAAFVQVGVKTWMFDNIPDICTRAQRSSLTCPHNQVSFTASAVWGLIGPSRQFGPNSIYHPEVFAVIIGAFLPIPFWLWQRRRPKSWVAYINTPVILVGCLYIPPATGINYSAWFAVGFVFQYIIRRRNFLWWSKFNYVTSAALDSGQIFVLCLYLLLIFLQAL